MIISGNFFCIVICWQVTIETQDAIDEAAHHGLKNQVWPAYSLCLVEMTCGRRVVTGIEIGETPSTDLRPLFTSLPLTATQAVPLSAELHSGILLNI